MLTPKTFQEKSSTISMCSLEVIGCLPTLAILLGFSSKYSFFLSDYLSWKNVVFVIILSSVWENEIIEVFNLWVYEGCQIMLLYLIYTNLLPCYYHYYCVFRLLLFLSGLCWYKHFSYTSNVEIYIILSADIWHHRHSNFCC